MQSKVIVYFQIKTVQRTLTNHEPDAETMVGANSEAEPHRIAVSSSRLEWNGVHYVQPGPLNTHPRLD